MTCCVERGVLLTLAYVGGPFHGFVEQSNVRTVAGEVLGAVQQIDPHVKSLRGVSRTDAGVHARGQLAAFDSRLTVPPRGWLLAINRHLPDEIAVRHVVMVPCGFDPRRYATLKWYRYSLLRDVRRDPFLDAVTWRIGGELDLHKARKEASDLVGTHDFAAFRSSADERTSTIRTISRLTIESSIHDPRVIFIDVWGTGFLHNMVRIIVGTLVDVARGKLDLGTMQRGLLTGDRSVLGITAPPQGLCLRHVELMDTAELGTEWPESGMQDTEAS